MHGIRKDIKRADAERSAVSQPSAARSVSASAPIGAPAAKIESIARPAGQVVAKQLADKDDYREQRKPDHANVSTVAAEKRREVPREKEMVGGIDAEVYSKLVRELGEPAQRRKRVDVPLAEKMYRLGWTHGQIAKHFGCSPCTIRRRLEEAIRRRASRPG